MARINYDDKKRLNNVIITKDELMEAFKSKTNYTRFLKENFGWCPEDPDDWEEWLKDEN